MKKLLTLFIVICMIFSAIPMTVSAGDHVETPSNSTIPAAPVADPDNFTVYVSGTGEDTNSGTDASPVKTLTKAYELATVDANNGKDVNICVLDDTTMTGNLDFGDHEGTVYIYGMKNASTNKYPTVKGNGSTTVFLVCGADTVLYNISFDEYGADLSSPKSFVINAAFHKLIIGENFSGGGRCQVTGAVWTYATSGIHYDNVHKDENNLPTNGAYVSIYSGTYYTAFATWRDSLTIANAATINHESVLNIYGNVTVTNLKDVSTTTTANQKVSTLVKAPIIINIYDGTMTFNATATSDGVKYTTLNISDSAKVTKAGGLSGLKSERKLFTKGEAKYCGIQTGTYEGKNAVRFVGTVDSLDYDAVGLQIITGEGYDFTTSCKTVYTKILGADNSNDYEYTTDDLGGEGIFAVVIKGIPSGTVTFDIRPFYTQDGVDYYGLRYTVTVKDGAFVSSVIN